MWRLARACEKSPNRSLLLHKEGPQKNKFFFPFCHFVVLSNISRDNILRRKDQNVAEIFKMDNTLFRDELVALENASAEEIRNTLMRFFDPFWRDHTVHIRTGRCSPVHYSSGNYSQLSAFKIPDRR